MTTDLSNKSVEELRAWAEGDESGFYLLEAFDELASRLRRLEEAQQKVAAEAKAEALEKIAKPLAMLGLQSDRYQDDNEFRDAVDDVLQAISCSAEYRAEAGRKE